MWNKDYFDRIARGELMRRRMTREVGMAKWQDSMQRGCHSGFVIFLESVTPLLQLAVGDFVGQLVTAASLFRGEFGRQDVSDLLNRFDQCIGKLFIPKMPAHFIDQALP